MLNIFNILNKVLLLENTRYCDIPVKFESTLNLNLAKYWASLGEAFVVDAFASLHRPHASVAGIAKYLPTYYGLLIKEEFNNNSPSKIALTLKVPSFFIGNLTTPLLFVVKLKNLSFLFLDTIT